MNKTEMDAFFDTKKQFLRFFKYNDKKIKCHLVKTGGFNYITVDFGQDVVQGVHSQTGKLIDIPAAQAAVIWSAYAYYNEGQHDIFQYLRDKAEALVSREVYAGMIY